MSTNRAEEKKEKEKKGLCEAKGWIFIPWAFNALGGMGKKVYNFFSDQYNFKRKHAIEFNMNEWQVMNEKKRFMQRASVAIWRHNYECFAANAKQALFAGGEAYGADVDPRQPPSSSMD